MEERDVDSFEIISFKIVYKKREYNCFSYRREWKI